MCGIFAYVTFNTPKSRREIFQVLLTGLLRLEYRGYDSAGCAVDDGQGGTRVWKAVGLVANLKARVAEGEDAGFVDERVSTSTGIAHTRWATHGQPSEVNAHPHRSDEGNQFVVVHNGIITNYRELRELLVSEGYVFESETDTEVIPKLAHHVWKGMAADAGGVPKFMDVVTEVKRHLQGSYALLFKSVHYPDELLCCRNGSPMILGIREAGDEPVVKDGSVSDESTHSSRSRGSSVTRSSAVMTATNLFVRTPLQPASPTSHGSGVHDAPAVEYFIASDAAAIVEHTRHIVHLEDGDILSVRNDGQLDLRKVDHNHPDRDPKPHTPPIAYLEMKLEEIMLGRYEHFMQKEIHEQPESLRSSMRGRLIPPIPGSGSDAFRVMLGGLHDYLPTIKRSRRLIFIACGTSFHACLATRQIFEELTEIPVCVELASDFMDRRCPIFRDDTCVFVSQSGETKDTLDALAYARGRQAICVGVVNSVGSAISRSTDCGVHINAGFENAVASTKAYTSQITVLMLIALVVSEDSRSKQERRQRIMAALWDLPGTLQAMLDRNINGEMLSLAKDIVDEPSMLVFGRGYQYATCLEAALKIKEVALVHSEGILMGEMKHGPLALVDEHIPLLCIATRDHFYSKALSAIEELLARNTPKQEEAIRAGPRTPAKAYMRGEDSAAASPASPPVPAGGRVAAVEPDAAAAAAAAPARATEVGKMIVLCSEEDRQDVSREEHVARSIDSDSMVRIARPWRVICVPTVVDCLQGIVNILPLQLLSYHITVLRGLSVDKPRNLAKSVTVE